MKQKLFEIYLRIFLLGTLLYYVPNQLQYIPQEKFFQYGAIGFLFLSFIVPQQRIINNMRLGILSIYVLISTLMLHNNDYSIMKLINIMLGIIVIKTIAERVDLNFKKIGYFFTVFCLFNVAQLCLQVLNIDPIFSNVNPQNTLVIDKTGLLSSRFILASVGAMMLPFMYAASPLSLLAVVPLLWFGKSSVCVVASALAIIIILSKMDRKKIGIFSAVFIGLALSYVILFDMPSGQFTKRFPIWLKGIEVLRGHPWFGMGLGSWVKTGFVTLQSNGTPEQWTWAHNDFLQWIFETGIAGGVLLWIWLKDMFSNTKDYICLASLVVLVSIGFFHFPFHIARLAGLGCFIVACLEAKRCQLCQE